MATSEHRAVLGRLSRLRRANRLAFVGALALALASCFAGAATTLPLWPGGLVAAIILGILSASIVERMALRTRCPNCGEPFFQRPVHIGPRWTAQENCVACRFNLYRGGNIQREC